MTAALAAAPRPRPNVAVLQGRAQGQTEGGAKRVFSLLGQSTKGLGESLRSQAESQPELFSLFLPRPTMT